MNRKPQVARLRSLPVFFLLWLLCVFVASTLRSVVVFESAIFWPQRGTRFTRGPMESAANRCVIAFQHPGISRDEFTFRRVRGLFGTRTFPEPRRGFTTQPGVAVTTAHPRKIGTKPSEPQRATPLRIFRLEKAGVAEKRGI